MDAPLYPPAKAYEPPRLSDTEFGVDSCSLADLMRAPAIRAMLNEEIPAFDAIVSSPQAQPYLAESTLRTMISSGLVTPETLARIDSRLRAFPISERPTL